MIPNVDPNSIVEILNEKFNRNVIDKDLYNKSLKELFNIYKSEDYKIIGGLGYYTFEKGSKMVVDTKDMIDEHKKLIKVLESESKEDDEEEVKEQKKELEDYKEKLTKSLDIVVSSFVEDIEKGRKAALLGQHSKSGNAVKTAQGWKPVPTGSIEPKDHTKHIEDSKNDKMECVRNYAGQRYSDEQINSILASLKTIGKDTNKLLELPQGLNEETKYEFINKKAKQLFRDLEPGSYDSNIYVRDVENILIGLMHAKLNKINF